MNVKEVIVLLSAMAVTGCSDPVRYSTPALDPDEVALFSSDQNPETAPQTQTTER